LEYSNASDKNIIVGIQNAKNTIVARSNEDRLKFLGTQGFSLKQADKIIQRVVNEEGHDPRSIWDFVQGISAVARDIGHTDDRITLEKQAGNLLKKVA
jgi:hypothetical protein